MYLEKQTLLSMTKIIKQISIAFILLPILSFSQTKITAIVADYAPKPIGAYSQAIKAGNTLYVSGQIALKLNGDIDTTSIENETTLVLQNIKSILTAANLQFSNVVKMTIYLTAIANFNKVNTIYTNYFSENFPARETVEVRALPKGAHIEISVIAVE